MPLRSQQASAETPLPLVCHVTPTHYAVKTAPHTPGRYPVRLLSSPLFHGGELEGGPTRRTHSPMEQSPSVQHTYPCYTPHPQEERWTPTHPRQPPASTLPYHYQPCCHTLSKSPHPTHPSVPHRRRYPVQTSQLRSLSYCCTPVPPESPCLLPRFLPCGSSRLPCGSARLPCGSISSTFGRTPTNRSRSYRVRLLQLLDPRLDLRDHPLDLFFHRSQLCTSTTHLPNLRPIYGIFTHEPSHPWNPCNPPNP